jgi:hypothetical protein
MKTTMKLFISAVVVGVCSLIGTVAHASIILAQNGPHASFNVIPFGPLFGAGSYQQLYSSSLFAGPMLIDSIAFSPDTTGTYSATSLAIEFTTTNVAIGALSPSLTSNYTRPLTTVFSSPVSESITGGSETFSLVFDFATPFLYNPALGNLLMEVDIIGQSGISGVSRADAGPISSRAFVSSSFGAGADAVALRTEFQVSAVPEPGILGLLGVGLAGLAASRARRRTQ